MAKLTRAMSRDGSLRAIVTDAPDIVNRAIQIHDTNPTATAAIGRVLLGASMMGSLMSEPDDLLTLRVVGDGIAGSIVVSADSFGNVRGFIQNPKAELPLREDGKLNVGGIVGSGNLYVLRDVGGEEPYNGICPLQSGEIAEDIAYYYAKSEQIPAVCALGVLVDVDYSCKAAGGVLIQLLPFADPEVVDILEKNVMRTTSVTDMLQRGGTELLLNTFLTGIEYDVFDNLETEYRCNCSKERTDKALLSLNDEARAELLIDGQLEMNCQFCDKKYIYTREELEKLYEQP
ncbi:MAG: hypothetical protein A2Y17_10845 [Clostridiales bacterium GWF2_38_85]|nr:MAG: hypothetical protein A2Y17_10845 [Clostridiales bacterium GWF2_38_85]HBL84624.1 Hsp33 family molecular chaperone HslO [Clostridiales bacterium]